MRLSVVAVCLSLCLIGFATANDAHASIRKDTNIPAEGLGPALNALAKDRNFQIVYVTEEIANLRTAGATGLFTTDEALKRLLIGTGLSYQYLDYKTITILPVDRASTQNDHAAPTARENQRGDVSDDKEGKKSSSGEFRVAQMDQGQSSATPSLANQATNSQTTPSAGLSEIIVTAQKRAERLQDVPIPLSVISSDALIESNQTRLEDYYSSVPGLNLAPMGTQATSILAIRGINTGIAGNPSVGITVDDVPFGAATNAGGGLVVPDLDPADLSRIEVLRGPQGTLYGASSLGGLIKFVTVDPTTEGFSARAQAIGEGVHNGAQAGYGFRGSANIPLSDTVAVRLSGFIRRDPGYIDNPVLHKDGVNLTDAFGGHLSALWKPMDGFSLKLSALWQEIRSDGSSDIDRPINGYIGPTLGDLQQNYPPGVGGYNRKSEAYSATLNWRVASADITAISGYNINSWHDSWYAPFFAGAAQAVYGIPTASSIALDENRTTKFSEDIHLTMPLGDRVDWLVGAFYTHEQSPYTVNYEAALPDTGQVIGEGLLAPSTSSYTEYAGFTDVTLKFTGQFDLQLGGRLSHIKQETTAVITGPFVGPDPLVIPDSPSSANAFTYLVTPRYKITPDLMLYVRLASGFRAGGPNGYVGGPQANVPLQYGPDKTNNYEFGVKSEFLEHRLSFDGSIYYIDWKNIQLSETAPSGASYVANAGRAKSEGVEMSLQAKPLRGLTVGAWVSYDNAVLTQDLPPSTVYGVAGTRIPYGSRFSSNLNANEEFLLSDRLTAFVGGAVSYIGNREGELTPSSPDAPLPPPRQTYPAYTKFDLNAGLKWNSWTANLFVNNVADRRGELAGGIGTLPAYAFTLIQPRTVGLSISTTF